MMTDRYQVLTYSGPASFMDNPDNRWIQVLDTQQRCIEVVAPERHRKLLTGLADALNTKERLRTIGDTLTSIGDVPQVIQTGEAVSEDMHNGAGAWPFGVGHGRYRWTYAACGTSVAYRTNATGLRLQGRVLQPHPVMAPAHRLVQLVDENGKVFASTPGVPQLTTEQVESVSPARQRELFERVAMMEGSRGVEQLRAQGTATGRLSAGDPPMGVQ
jgi:hypothetical protein